MCPLPEPTNPVRSTNGISDPVSHLPSVFSKSAARYRARPDLELVSFVGSPTHNNVSWGDRRPSQIRRDTCFLRQRDPLVPRDNEILLNPLNGSQGSRCSGGMSGLGKYKAQEGRVRVCPLHDNCIVRALHDSAGPKMQTSN